MLKNLLKEASPMLKCKTSGQKIFSPAGAAAASSSADMTERGDDDDNDLCDGTGWEMI